MEQNLQVCKRYLMKTSILLALFLCAVTLSAQLPSTQIYTLSLKANEAKVIIDNPVLVTGFNPDGYNNQPHFVDDDHLLITSSYQSLGLTDILELDTRLNRITRITQTEESEYSPIIMSSGLDFSVVRQELDDSPQVPQVLWSYPTDRSTSGELVIPDVEDIGYYTWVTRDRIAMFIVSETPYLALYDMRSHTSTRIASDIGRCLKSDDKGHIYYIQKSPEGDDIRSYDIYLGRSKRIAPAIDGQQDFEILHNGHLIAADGATLMTYIPSVSTRWKKIKDLSSTGINNISRIASSQNKVAIVTSK